MFDPDKARLETPVVEDVMNSHAYLNWGWKHKGFGQLSWYLDKETGKITMNDECMSREDVRRILHAYADYIADNAISE